ncbi:MAG: dihydrofolate reductase family protein [Nitriliruptorales bacterium]
MRRLFPDPHEAPLDELYLDLAFSAAPSRRPHVYLDMIASVDGAATLAGRTAGLGGPADKLVFHRLRETCDAILVGASTVRIEDYGPPRPSEEAQARRRARGLASVPRLVVMTATAALSPASRVFSDPQRRPLVITVEDAPSHRVEELQPVADIVQAGVSQVDLGAAMARLRAEGMAYVLCEGGPTLNGQLLAARVVDELFLTLAPQVVGTSPRRIVEGELGLASLPVELMEAHEHSGELLLRYRFAYPNSA